MNPLIGAIQLVGLALTLVVLLDMVLSFVLNPFHPVRRALDAFVNPMLAPIRRLLPPLGMLDFSPMVLMILIQIVQEILVQLLRSLG